MSRKFWHMLLNLCLHICLTFGVFAGGINQTRLAGVCQAVSARLLQGFFELTLKQRLTKAVRPLPGGHLAALLHPGHRPVGGRHCTQHLQAGDAQGQALRRAGRAPAPAAAHVEVRTPSAAKSQLSSKLPEGVTTETSAPKLTVSLQVLLNWRRDTHHRVWHHCSSEH